jgi:hypothetical protein
MLDFQASPPPNLSYLPILFDECAICVKELVEVVLSTVCFAMLEVL